MVHNYTEIAVRQLLQEVLENFAENNQGTCTCGRCKDDIVALTLNNLPPNYVSSNTGIILTKLNFDQIGGRAQVTAAIMNAIKVVANNPHK